MFLPFLSQELIGGTEHPCLSFVLGFAYRNLSKLVQYIISTKSSILLLLQCSTDVVEVYQLGGSTDHE